MLDEINKFSLIFKNNVSSELEAEHKSHDILYNEQKYTLNSFSIGSSHKDAATLLLVGGIHGLERIGAQLCFHLLQYYTERTKWDKLLIENLKKNRLVFIPLANPYGYQHFKRSNGNGVDLMRNSPIKSEEKVPFLIGGQNFSNKLPWYMGTAGQLEPENEFIEKIFHEYSGQSKYTISIDFHSGFGLQDRIWFPFSHTKKIFDYQGQLNSLLQLFTTTYPHHIYKIEPQGQSYFLNGDLWDYLFLQDRSKFFIPLTLEMGSWNWVKKNPLQALSPLGIYNPIKNHRLKRTYRRHHLLVDFLLNALYSNEVWTK